MPYKTFNKNQFHYENGQMVDNQTGKTYTQSATNGNDVVILGIPKMPVINDNTFVKRPDIISDIDRAEIAAKLNAARREHRQQVGAAQDDAEQASNYLNEQLNKQPTIYGQIADGIHTVANLGVAGAYASGNQLAILGASGYAIPSTLKRWFAEGIDSNEMLANATPTGRLFSKTKMVYPKETPKSIKLDPNKDFLGVNINTGDADQVVLDNSRQFSDQIKNQWEKAEHGTVARIGNGAEPGEGLSHDSAPNWFGLALRKIRDGEGFVTRPEAEPAMVRLNTVSPKGTDPNQRIQWTQEYVDNLGKRVNLINQAAGTDFPMPKLVHVKTPLGKSIPKVLIPNMAIGKRQKGGKLWINNNTEKPWKKL